MSSNLKPCPFCGQHPSHRASFLHSVACRSPQCHVQPRTAGWDTIDDIQAAWNTRAPENQSTVCTTCGKRTNDLCSNSFHLPSTDRVGEDQQHKLEYLISRIMTNALYELDFQKEGVECRPIANRIYDALRPYLRSNEQEAHQPDEFTFSRSELMDEFEAEYADTAVDLKWQSNDMAAGHGSVYEDRETDDMFNGFEDGFRRGYNKASLSSRKRESGDVTRTDLIAALRRCASALDTVMDDSDLVDDESPEFLACQNANALLSKIEVETP